ncbi:tetratricopeptide repeat protein [Neolewinella antarctica]|uniref:Class 3 adenylate cyclase/tetratricopeptide (TPR) repeat protein n=1 Tax=Neolewinella antarctica TaxID=442734 RepID=A0ABX0XEE7_9BACT|nr:tetratricopeptide repeat protein [Neolewinella antarctica]NJC27470.1 class 3 adenylate cyclase/tetratricopeptide (TPR) repeat protein [Neolewinella antarctica]
MQPLIPPFIQQRLLAGDLSGEIAAFTLNVDLSGFTPLTESLMKEGISGAEKLSQILNEVFEPLVSLVYKQGGIIPYFAGDAFTAVFPLPLTRIHAQQIIQITDKARKIFTARDSVFGGKYRIGVKAGVAAGKVNYGIVGDELKAFYFRGGAINDASVAQTKANEGEIVLSANMNALLEGRETITEEITTGYYRLVGEPSLNTKVVLPTALDLPAVDPKVAAQFLPPEVVRYDQAGEFRTVVSIFLAFEAVHTHEDLSHFAAVVLNQVDDFGGYFKEVDYGDKGSLMVIFFGAPVSYENITVRALEFALTVQSELLQLKEEQQANFRFRLGMTVGTAFTGIVGGQERAQYACVGNRVNLAARIMGAADWQDILVDDELAAVNHFRFELRGNTTYKGIEKPVQTFALVGRRQSLGKPNYGNQLVGREQETKQLLKFAQPIFGGKMAGVAYVLGEAGIGKSRLTYEVRRQLNERQAINWMIASSDQILRKPFNSFVYLLQRMFRQSPDLGRAQNQRRFQFRLSQIRQRLQQLETDRTTQILTELDRTESILSAQLGIVTPHSLWTQLDAQGRYLNTIAAFVNLLQAEAVMAPTVLELEDIHWMDDDSRTVVRQVIRRSYDLPLLIIATSRADDDGNYPHLKIEKDKKTTGLEVLKIEIGALTTDAVRRMAETTLGAPITEDTMATLLRTTNSNPFYLEQVLEYFRENELLVKNDRGVLTLSDESIKLSTSISSILTARIDRLSDMVRETVKAAAVIGREFDLPVLTEVLREETGLDTREEVVALLKEQVDIAERGQIWSAMSELRYIFRHSLLREAVYSMQLTTRLQQLHHQTATVIERLYGDALEERYVDLAFHYEHAGSKEKTIEFLSKAANYARANFQNQQALNLYQRLIEKFTNHPDEDMMVNTHVGRGKVLEIVGRWEEAETSYLEAQRLAKASRDIVLLGRTNNHLGRLYTFKGEYDKAMEYLKTAGSLFESVDDILGISKAYGSMGNVYFRTADYQHALEYYNQSLDQGFSHAGISSSAETISHLGLTHMNLGDYAEGIRIIEEQIPLHQANQDSMGLASLHTNLGIVYFESGDFEKAMENHHAGLELAKELGNKRLQAIGLGSLGSVYERQGKFSEAAEHFEQDLLICNELGDLQGIAVTEGLIGDINTVMGNFTIAIQHLDHSLAICRELGYRKGIAKAVNTLGDIYYLQGQYDISVMYYDQAIDIARATNNKLVLVTSLEEKGRVLLASGQLEALQEVAAEAYAMAEELGNPGISFVTALLHARSIAACDVRKTAESARKIQDLLAQEEIDDEQRAEAYLSLHQVSGGLDEHARERSLELYRALYEQTPKFIYNYHIANLESGRHEEAKI